jgi:hypothetical protein
MVRFATGFEGWTTGVRASMATLCSTGLTFLDFASSSSSFFISREDMATCVVLSMRALMPFPDPPPEMEMFTSGFFFMYASAVACPIGSTVVEPLTTRFSAARADAPPITLRATRAAMRMFNIRVIFISSLECGLIVCRYHRWELLQFDDRLVKKS